MTDPNPPVAQPETKSVIMRRVRVQVANKVFTTMLGLSIMAFGILFAWYTMQQPNHKDWMILVWAGVAVFGALICSPTTVGGALKTMADTARQFVPSFGKKDVP